MDTTDWQNYFKRNIEDIRNLNGHFCGVKWDTDYVALFTDALGLREMYLTKLNDLIIFSTRLDWLMQLRGNCRINFEQFGSAWLSFNQLSHHSVITEIDRLGPGCIAFLKNQKISYRRQLWLPNLSQNSSEERVIEKIKKFALFPLYHNRMISLGLSGGIDSRVLLATLSSQENKNWSLHSFGDPQHPDILVARDIAKKLNLKLTIVNTELPPVDDCIHMIKNHFGQNTIHIPASEIMRLRWYIPLHQQKKIVIDGGFGEIARRQYLNRLSFFGKNALLQKHSTAIASFLRHHRGDIFHSDASARMERGFLQQIDHYLETMPDVENFGKENWLDLLAIRSRLANWNGFAQACIDGLAVNYMPFAQKEFLNEVLTLPVKLRKNGRLWRKIIREYQPALTRFPLVKGSTTYPFKLSTIGTMIWTSAKGKLGMYYRDLESAMLIDHLSEFILDVVHSDNVKSYPYYNYAKILHMVENYFAGDKRHAREIDWWLAFELWRTSL